MYEFEPRDEEERCREFYGDYKEPNESDTTTKEYENSDITTSSKVINAIKMSNSDNDLPMKENRENDNKKTNSIILLNINLVKYKK